MPDAWNLAIEASGHDAFIALGCGSDLTHAREVVRSKRHNLDLLPTIDQAMREMGYQRNDLSAVFVSTGPGSFTGLRIGLAAAKMLGQSLGCDMVAVPTLEALAMNIPAGHRDQPVAVCLNTKHEAAYSGIRLADHWVMPPAMREFNELWQNNPAPVYALGQKLGELPDAVTALDDALTRVRAESVYAIGAKMLAAGQTVTPEALLPEYGREPEAVRLWEQRKSQK